MIGVILSYLKTKFILRFSRTCKNNLILSKYIKNITICWKEEIYAYNFDMLNKIEILHLSSNKFINSNKTYEILSEKCIYTLKTFVVIGYENGTSLLLYNILKNNKKTLKNLTYYSKVTPCIKVNDIDINIFDTELKHMINLEYLHIKIDNHTNHFKFDLSKLKYLWSIVLEIENFVLQSFDFLPTSIRFLKIKCNYYTNIYQNIITFKNLERIYISDNVDNFKLFNFCKINKIIMEITNKEDVIISETNPNFNHDFCL